MIRTMTALSLAALAALPALAVELVMVEQPGCIYCERWDKEIAPAYPKTAEGKFAPLRRVDIDEPLPADLTDISPIVFTPTFVVVENGKEISRLVGYPGEDFFWPLLARELVKLPEPCPN